MLFIFVAASVKCSVMALKSLPILHQNADYISRSINEHIRGCSEYGPRQANLVLIACASSEGSGEPAHPRSLARTFALAHISSESRGTFRQKARSLAPLNGWACAVIICHDGMLEDTNSFDGAHLQYC